MSCIGVSHGQCTLLGTVLIAQDSETPSSPGLGSRDFSIFPAWPGLVTPVLQQGFLSGALARGGDYTRAVYYESET